MTAATLTLSDVVTAPYSAARLARMDRANRITRLMFNARRRGGNLTALEAAELVDAEIDQPNLPTVDTKPTPATKPVVTSVRAFIIAANQPAANDAKADSNVITRTVAKARHKLSQSLRTLSVWIGGDLK